MPFDVTGWVEISWGDGRSGEPEEWAATICLDRFMLQGDKISEYFFGLAKGPSRKGLFAGRGRPDDASEIVDRCFREDDTFQAQYGEGDFGYTHVLWSEMEPYYNKLDQGEVRNSEWQKVFSLINQLARSGFRPEAIRLVVWANW